MTTAIILAGGLGTRLRSRIPDLPKCMAPVNGKPFLAYVLDHLRRQGLQDVVLSLGYMADVVRDYAETNEKDLNLTYYVEQSPLGTGGAIRATMKTIGDGKVVVLNGDTLFLANLTDMIALHERKGADCTLALKPMRHFERYGVVDIDAEGSIVSFQEKRYYESGLINAGAYVLDRSRFLDEDLPAVFSFEKDYLEKYFTKRRMFALVQDAYFIDIGIPEDYERAQRELPDLHA